MIRDKRSNMKHALAALLFCMVMSFGIISYADGRGTVTVPSGKIRSSADLSSEQIGSVALGGTVDIITETTGSDGKVWYQVYVDANTKGYIRSDLVKKAGGSGIPTPNTTNSDQTATTATPLEARKGTVTTNKVNIRKGASTNHDVVAKANRGMVVTVTGEAAGSDGNKWWQISFTYNDKEITGFIRADLVTFDNVPADPAVSEITGEGNAGEGTPEEDPGEVQPPEPEQTPDEPSNDSGDIVLMNVEETPYIMPGFVSVDLNWNDQKINAYKNGNFYIFYARKQSGEEGWYLFDSEKGLYQRYVYTSADAKIPDGGKGSTDLIPLIVLIGIIIVLAAVVGLLALKLRGHRDYDDDYEDDYPEDDIEDFDEPEEEEPQPARRPQPQPRPQPARRPQPQQSRPQPARRPQPQGESIPQDRQPARRPQPQGESIPQDRQPARRPQPQGGNAPQGPQSARRPQSQDGNAPLGHPQGTQPARRPQPQGENAPQGSRQTRPASGQGHPQGGRPHPQGKRPQPQKDRVQPSKGSKAKNPLEDDDDMDYMDI